MVRVGRAGWMRNTYETLITELTERDQLGELGVDGKKYVLKYVRI